MRKRQSFRSDERAIEGLPIRLVIAVVVGVACLAAMTSIIGGIGDVGESEVDVSMEDRLVQGSSETIEMTVVDDDGEPVEDATVDLESGTAQLDISETTNTTNSDGKVQFSDIDTRNSATSSIDWNSNQDKGTIKVDIIPPGDGDYKDERGNTEIIVKKS